MKCREAARLAVRAMFGELDDVERAELERHLFACPKCQRRVARYEDVRNQVRGLDGPACPEVVTQVLLERVREGAARGAREGPAPADPRPEHSTGQKVLIFVLAMVGMVVLSVCLLVAFRSEFEPIPLVGEAVFHVGTVQVRQPGSSNWHQIAHREPLPPGAAVRTDQDGLLQLRGEGADWWLDGASALALGEGAAAELAGGRIYVRCNEGLGVPVRLFAGKAAVSCAGGEFVARATRQRLMVGAVCGTVTVSGAGDERTLEAGQMGMWAEGAAVGPVRPVSTAQLTHWLKRFVPPRTAELPKHRLAAVAMPPERPALPKWVKVERLDLDVVLRGPLALVSLAARLRNNGAEAWQVAPAASDLLLPAPLAETATSVNLEPGQTETLRAAALCALTERHGRYSLSVNPLAWTESAVGAVSLHLDAAAEGGIRELAAPFQGYSMRREQAVDWRWSAEAHPPDTPLLIEAVLPKKGVVDAVRVGPLAACGWRPDAGGDQWVRRGVSVLLAFDATADFGARGLAYGHEVVEGLVGAIPPAVPTALLAYDGQLRAEQQPWARHFPARAESMTAALWALDGASVPSDTEGGDVRFFATALGAASGAEGERLLIYVTGAGPSRGDEVLGGFQPDAANVRVCVIQIGAEHADPFYARVCAATGGAVFPLDARVAPDLAAADVVAAMHRPTVAGPALYLEGGALGRIVAGQGASTNVPVVGLAPLARGQGTLAGSFRAIVGGRELRREFTAPLESAVRISPALCQELAEALRGRTAQ